MTTTVAPITSPATAQPQPEVILSTQGLTKRFGARLAVDGLSLEVRRGDVFALLGPNGSGKTTTLRMLLGLVWPTSGSISVFGQDFSGDARRQAALRRIGAVVEQPTFYPYLNARENLGGIATFAGLAATPQTRARIAWALDQVGLTPRAGDAYRKYSLGMKQRLGIAAALIGDPPVLLFDEPINGLDPEGIRWIRTFMQGLAAEGRTVFVSSHLMSEMALTATELIVIGQGRLIAAESVEKFTERADSSERLRSPQLDEMATALAVEGASLWRNGDALEIVGFSIEQVGAIAARVGAIVYELSPQRASLEEAFMQLTAAVCEYVPMQQGA